MPSRTTKVDVTSAVIQWSPMQNWLMGNLATDPVTSLFDQGTFINSHFNLSRASFNFTGSQLNIVGSYRSAHGPYKVYFDDVPMGPFRTDPTKAPRNNNPLMQQTLFSWQGEEGFHRVIFENYQIPNQTNPYETLPQDPTKHLPIVFVDIDYVNWTSTVSSSNDFKIQDNDARFHYDQSWNTNVLGLPEFDESTGHYTRHPGSSVNLTFLGDRITLYGLTGISGTLFEAQLDQNPALPLNSSLPTNDPGQQQILFYASGLADGPHTLRLTANPHDFEQVESKILAIDYAVVDGSVNGAGSTSSLSARTIASITAGVVVAFVAILSFLALGLNRRRRARRKAAAERRMSIDMSQDGNYNLTTPHPNLKLEPLRRQWTPELPRLHQSHYSSYPASTIRPLPSPDRYKGIVAKRPPLLVLQEPAPSYHTEIL